MENRKRKSRKKTKPVKKVELIDFDSWFWFKLRENNVKPWQKAEIKVFFDGKGLKEKESRSKYEEILKLY